MALSRKPHYIGKSTWFYDDPKGLLVVHEARTKSNAFIQADQFIISWRMIANALKRKNSK